MNQSRQWSLRGIFLATAAVAALFAVLRACAVEWKAALIISGILAASLAAALILVMIIAGKDERHHD